jgi:hypothetical protein
MVALVGYGQNLGAQPGWEKGSQKVIFSLLIPTRFSCSRVWMRENPGGYPFPVSSQTRRTAILPPFLFSHSCYCCLQISGYGSPVLMTAEVTNCSSLTPRGLVGPSPRWLNCTSSHCCVDQTLVTALPPPFKAMSSKHLGWLSQSGHLSLFPHTLNFRTWSPDPEGTSVGSLSSLLGRLRHLL